jgi:hypothetical protein
MVLYMPTIIYFCPMFRDIHVAHNIYTFCTEHFRHLQFDPIFHNLLSNLLGMDYHATLFILFLVILCNFSPIIYHNNYSSILLHSNIISLFWHFLFTFYTFLYNINLLYASWSWLTSSLHYFYKANPINYSLFW